jgi:hypothetical protein
MSKQKSATNSRKGGGKKTTSGASSGGGATRNAAPTARRSQAAQSVKARKNARASGATPAEKRHAGIRRS